LPKFGSTTASAITDTLTIEFLENEEFAIVAGSGNFLEKKKNKNLFFFFF
jgi:hypothetical protein